MHCFFFVNDKNILGIGKTWPEGFQISLDIVVYYAVFTPVGWIPFAFPRKKWITFIIYAGFPHKNAFLYIYKCLPSLCNERFSTTVGTIGLPRLAR